MAQPVSWPRTAPTYRSVVLREFDERDAHLAVELSEDPYIPLIGSLPPHPTAEEARRWIDRQRARLAEGIGFSFAIADATTDQALGAIGLWIQELETGGATAGYSVSPLHRRRGIASDALRALTTFAWTIPALHRVELYIEPWNVGSIAVARASGYRFDGLLERHQEIGGVHRDMQRHVATRHVEDRMGLT